MKVNCLFGAPRRLLLAALLTVLGVIPVSAEHLYVSDPAYGFVHLFSLNGKETEFAVVNSAEGLAFDSSGNLDVTDLNDSIIYQLSPDGSHRTRLHSRRGISNPSALAFDSAGNLYIALNGTHAGISVLSPGGMLTRFARHVEPTGLAFDSAGNLFATDYVTNTVLKYAPDGTKTTFATGFGQPADVKFDLSGNLFVSDLGAGIIYKITPEGTKTAFATGINQPLGLAFSSAGDLYVGAYPQILKITPDGTQSVFAHNVFAQCLLFGP
jgi:sugar lactone lactonase YvrE